MANNTQSKRKFRVGTAISGRLHTEKRMDRLPAWTRQNTNTFSRRWLDIRRIDLVGSDRHRAVDYHMADFKPDLMILGVLADMFPGDERDRAQAGRLLTCLRR
jgi:hypothetical protein